MSDARRPVSVMVVDDDEDIRGTLEEVLETAGYSVVIAGNGQEALDLLRGVRPRVIFLDLSMPIMSGREFRAAQLADPELAAIPVVVMTAADRIAEKTEGMQIDEILGKPFKLQRFLDLAARHCRGEPA